MLLNDIIRFLAKSIPAVIFLLSVAIPPRGNSLLAAIEQMVGYVRTEQASIAGVTVGSTEKQVFDAFGKTPELKDLRSGRDGAKKVRLYRYSGVDVEVTGGRVSAMRCRASRYATPDGVRVGYELRTVLQVYLATRFEALGDERLAWYRVMNTDAFLVFRFRGGVVSEIELCGTNACDWLPR